MSAAHVVTTFVLLACAPASGEQDLPCGDLPGSFVAYFNSVLADTTGRFFNDYPTPTRLTCELLAMLREEMNNDSVRYQFEHLHQRYGDPRASAAFTYIKRHNHFHLAISLATHWNPDTRIEAIRAVHNYRRIRPMVCATREHYAQLERQDRAAVRYLLRILETTPLGIPGSENSTIHDIYIRSVMETLDLFTGRQHVLEGDQRMRVDLSPDRLEKAMADWREWLEQ